MMRTTTVLLGLLLAAGAVQAKPTLATKSYSTAFEAAQHELARRFDASPLTGRRGEFAKFKATQVGPNNLLPEKSSKPGITRYRGLITGDDPDAVASTQVSVKQMSDGRFRAIQSSKISAQ